MEQDQGHGRHLSDIAEILAGSSLPPRVTQNALAVFTRLADAEAKIHGTSRDQIHFHEVGAVDAIVDIVGSCLLLDMLGVERVVTSSIPCGYGTIACQHGIMPVPAPATMELLQGFPVHSVDIRGELVTPTGAALLTTLSDPAMAGKMPAMRVVDSGFGAGKKQFKPDMPNLLRVILGETEDASDRTPQTVAVLETNLDDQNPEGFDLLMERAFAAGAVDVFFAPIQMKKNRPATLVTLLCPPDKADALAGLLFRETGTFGSPRPRAAAVDADPLVADRHNGVRRCPAQGGRLAGGRSHGRPGVRGLQARRDGTRRPPAPGLRGRAAAGVRQHPPARFRNMPPDGKSATRNALESGATAWHTMSKILHAPTHPPNRPRPKRNAQRPN